MKFCPVCQTRYDEEILRFCTKDGTLLVEENPIFTELPSESEADDIGEETLIRRNPPRAIPPVQPDDEEDFSEPGQRIVIPMTEEEKEPPVRAKIVPEPRYEQPRKSNTALVVLVTMMGTLLVLGALSGVWYFLSARNTADSNSDKNINVNLNSAVSNSNIDTNFNINNSLGNFNANANENVNANVNANLATPTRTPTPTPTKTPENENTNANANLNLGNTNVMSRPSPSPGETPAVTPRVTPSPETTPPSNVNVGIMNSRAVNLVKPAYPQTARQVNASGQVMVQISVDEDGNVLSAKAVSGHPLLRPSAENAARQSRFNPVKVNDRAVRANGIIVYNFINQ